MDEAAVQSIGQLTQAVEQLTAAVGALNRSVLVLSDDIGSVESYLNMLVAQGAQRGQ